MEDNKSVNDIIDTNNVSNQISGEEILKKRQDDFIREMMKMAEMASSESYDIGFKNGICFILKNLIDGTEESVSKALKTLELLEDYDQCKGIKEMFVKEYIEK